VSPSEVAGGGKRNGDESEDASRFPPPARFYGVPNRLAVLLLALGASTMPTEPHLPDDAIALDLQPQVTTLP
jgi:hypothetical protein